MDLRQLENIVAIAEERSISRAAERLFISQPALSQQVSKLEARLGVPLFSRDKQGLSLTQAGKVYVENAKKILSIRDETYNRIYDIAAYRKGSISIGVSPGRSPMIVSKIYPQFQREFPGFNIQVFDNSNAQTTEMLIQGTLDLGFLLLSDKEISARLPISHLAITQEDMYLVTSKNHPMAARYHNGSQGRMIDLRLFQNETFALPTKGAKIRLFVDEIFASYGISPNVCYQVYNIQSIITVVSESRLCTIIPAGFLPDNENLIYFRLKPNRFMEFSICWNSNHRMTTAEKFFVELCQKVYL